MRTWKALAQPHVLLSHCFLVMCFCGVFLSTLQYAGKELSAEQVQATVEELKKVVEASRERRRDRMARKGTEDFDEEEEEALEEENEQEDEVIDQVGLQGLGV